MSQPSKFKIYSTNRCASVDFLDVKNLQGGVVASMQKLNCPNFNSLHATMNGTLDYIKHETNVVFIEQQLPSKIRGITMAMEKDINKFSDSSKMRIKRNYFIAINSLLDPFLKLFITLHELGHVLLHRDLIRIGNVLTNYQNCKEDLLGYAADFEIEANIYALIQLIPDHELTAFYNKKKLSTSGLCDTYKITKRIASDRIKLFTIRHFATDEEYLGDNYYLYLKRLLSNPEYPIIL